MSTCLMTIMLMVLYFDALFSENNPYSLHNQAKDKILYSLVTPFKSTFFYCKILILIRLYNLYPGYIMQNARLDEAQAGIKTAGRNINNLRYSDDTTLMAESVEELKSLLMKVKEE